MNACIVGYGAVGPVHAAAVNGIKNARVYAVVDTNIERAEACHSEYGCKVYSDFDMMLGDREIDVVHICTPHYLHKSMARAALLAGKNVVLEKPATLTLADLEDLIRIARGSKGRIAVVLQNRRNPSVRMLREIIEDGRYGRLLGLIGGVYWHRDENYYNSGEWRGRWETEGGGALINQSIHMLDMMIHLAGEVGSVRSALHHWQIEGIEVEDNVHALIDFKSGVKGVFNATNCYVKDEPYMLEATFESGRVRYADARLYVIDEEGAHVIARDEGVMVGKSYWGSGHFTLIRDFYSALEGEAAEYTTLDDAYETMRVAFGIYEGAGIIREPEI